MILIQTTGNTASHRSLEYAERLILINAEIILLLMSFNEIGTELKLLCENVWNESKNMQQIFWSQCVSDMLVMRFLWKSEQNKKRTSCTIK